MTGVVLDTTRFITQCVKEASATLYARNLLLGISETTQVSSEKTGAGKDWRPAPRHSLCDGRWTYRRPKQPGPTLR